MFSLLNICSLQREIKTNLNKNKIINYEIITELADTSVTLEANTSGIAWALVSVAKLPLTWPLGLQLVAYEQTLPVWKSVDFLLVEP